MWDTTEYNEVGLVESWLARIGQSGNNGHFPDRARRQSKGQRSHQQLFRLPFNPLRIEQSTTTASSLSFSLAWTWENVSSDDDVETAQTEMMKPFSSERFLPFVPAQSQVRRKTRKLMPLIDGRIRKFDPMCHAMAKAAASQSPVGGLAWVGSVRPDQTRRMSSKSCRSHQKVESDTHTTSHE